LGGVGIGGVALYLLANVLFGTELRVEDILGQLEQVALVQQQNIDQSAFEGEDSYEVFASTVLGSNNDLWQTVFNRSGQTYQEPRLVLFRTATNSGCGTATSQVGPHYCPLDQTIYLDETFFDELEQRLGAQGGDVAEAYVMSHEVGHHIQHQLGILDQAHQASASQPNQSNDISIQVELQADCLAGLWANSIRDAGVFLPGEIEEAMDAAAAVGDDRIQEKVTGHIQPESWTHGSAEERVHWFTKGYETGQLSACEFAPNS
jgi:uncharacterized protein